MTTSNEDSEEADFVLDLKDSVDSSHDEEVAYDHVTFVCDVTAPVSDNEEAVFSSDSVVSSDKSLILYSTVALACFVDAVAVSETVTVSVSDELVS
jgi:hypothetical protein